jgi:hypothetical protein
VTIVGARQGQGQDQRQRRSSVRELPDEFLRGPERTRLPVSGSFEMNLQVCAGPIGLAGEWADGACDLSLATGGWTVLSAFICVICGFSVGGRVGRPQVPSLKPLVGGRGFTAGRVRRPGCRYRGGVPLQPRGSRDSETASRARADPCVGKRGARRWCRSRRSRGLIDRFVPHSSPLHQPVAVVSLE